MDRAAFVSGLTRHYGVSPDEAEEAATRKYGPPAVEIPAADAHRLEKQIEHQCDVMMQQLGFEIIKFSHPGKTKQTPGISDRRYMRRPRPNGNIQILRHASDRVVQETDDGYALWFEVKADWGIQRPGQKLFQELVTACGEHYLCGGTEELAAWCVAEGIATRNGDRLEPIGAGTRGGGG